MSLASIALHHIIWPNMIWPAAMLVIGMALGVVGVAAWRTRARAVLLLGLAGVVAALAIGWSASRDRADPAPSPLTDTAQASPALADVDTMTARLAARIAAHPEDGEGQRLLGWAYMMTGHPDRALEPYRAAQRLLPASASAREGYGEALAGIAGGTVTREAHEAFAEALRRDPAEPRARYFLALEQAQHGDLRNALERWIALANEGPADAPWQGEVRDQIAATAERLGIDVSRRLRPIG